MLYADWILVDVLAFGLVGVTVSVSARLFVYVVANPYFLPAQFKKYGG